MSFRPLFYWLVFLTLAAYATVTTAAPTNNGTKAPDTKPLTKILLTGNTTVAPTTVAQTAAPATTNVEVSTAAPTAAPTTLIKITTTLPTTNIPTNIPTNNANKTADPTTAAPATTAPTTTAPVTAAPATNAPASNATSTTAPSTTVPATDWIAVGDAKTITDSYIIPSLGKEFAISFNYTAKSDFNQISLGDVGGAQPYSTKPGLRLYYQASGKRQNFTMPTTINTTYSIRFIQKKTDSSTYITIKVDGKVNSTVENTNAASATNVTIATDSHALPKSEYKDFIVYKIGKPVTTTAAPTSAPTTAAPTPVPIKLYKVSLKKTQLTTNSVTFEWTRDSSNVSVASSVVLKIVKGGATVQTETVSVNSTSKLSGKHTFSGLKPYSNYSLTALEKSLNDEGPESELPIQTQQAAPSAPRSLTSSSQTKDSIVIKWEAPSNLNGILVGYRINYTFVGNPGAPSIIDDVPASTNSYKLSNLFPFVKYSILVQAKTVAYGPNVSITVETMKSAPYQSPNKTRIGTQIALPEEHNSKVNATIIWDALPFYLRGSKHVEYKVSGVSPKDIYTNKTSLVVTLNVYTDYELQLSAENNEGSSMPYVWKFKTKMTPPSKPRGVKLVPIRTDRDYHQINMTWNAPEYPNGISEYFQYEIQKCSNGICKRSFPFTRILPLKSPSSRSFLIGGGYGEPRLDAYTKYLVSVREQTCAGCWGDYSDKLEVMTEPGDPGRVEKMTSTHIDSGSLTVVWSPPRYPRGIIKRYEVELVQENVLKEKSEITADVGKTDYEKVFDDLDSETGYYVKITAINHGGNRGVTYQQYFMTLQSKLWLFILIGCLVLVLIVVLVLSTYLLVSRRRRTYKEVRSTDDIELTKTKSKVIPLTNFKSYCAQQHCNSDHGFQQEYELLRIPHRQFTWEYSAMPCNSVKNRYSNIVAYDHSRVILETIEDDPSSSYINANYIDGYLREKQYIATQGPLPETIIDFWRMVWDEKCPIIVMLTKLVEDNKLKCEQYWPEGKAMQYREIVVTITSVKEMTDMTVKVLKLHKINNPEEGSRTVYHFHYTAWPDHGVPAHPTSMLSFIRHVMSYFPKELTSPIIVHCSAGVGRTGTFIAIEGLLRQMEHHDQVDIYGTVLHMRMQRNFMVQTESQYTFIYDALLDNAVCGNTEIQPENLVARIKYLNEQDDQTGETHFMAEFKRLESGFKLKDKDQFSDASHPENKTKNRFLNILPFDRNRIRLTPIPGHRLSDYINASIVDGFQQKHAFIATQAPLENTVVDFWRMVSEQNVHIIVMLTKIEEKGQEKCYLYWPQAGMVSYGNIHVEVINVRNQDDIYIIHDLRITNRESGKSWPVTHFLYLGWPEYHGSPDSGTDLIHFIGLVEKTQRSLTDIGPTLVHCSGGVGRTGVFITVFNSVERLKAKNMVDVFQTTRALRLQRSAMVQTIDQYKFCYQCLKDYLDSFDLYANPEC